MKTVLILALVCSPGLISARAEETMGEKAKAQTHDIKRKVKKGANRAEEAVCDNLTGNSRTECLAKKIENRSEEMSDTVKDKAKELKNKADSHGH